MMGFVMVLLWVCGILPGFSEGLYCYSCAGSSVNSSCQLDVKSLVQTRINFEGIYSIDCDLEVNQTMCVIEAAQKNGGVTSIIRGCSDGYTFSYQDVKLFRNLKPTNQTRCAARQGQVLCVTLCRQDYCNGPQDLTATASSFAHVTKLCIISGFGIYFCYILLCMENM